MAKLFNKNMWKNTKNIISNLRFNNIGFAIFSINFINNVEFPLNIDFFLYY